MKKVVNTSVLEETDNLAWRQHQTKLSGRCLPCAELWLQSTVRAVG